MDRNKKEALESALKMSSSNKGSLEEGRRKLFETPPAKYYGATINFNEDIYNVSRAYAYGHSFPYSEFFDRIVKDFFASEGIDVEKVGLEIRPYYRLEGLLRKWFKQKSINLFYFKEDPKFEDFDSERFMKRIGTENLSETTNVAYNLKLEIDNLPNSISLEASESLGNNFYTLKRNMQRYIDMILKKLKNEYKSPFFDEEEIFADYHQEDSQEEEEENKEDSF